MFFDLTYTNYNFSHRVNNHPTLSDDFVDHFHKVYELMYVVSGNGTLHLDKENYQISPGDCVLILPNQKHYMSFEEDAPYERYIVKFPHYDVPRKLIPILPNHGGHSNVIHTEVPDLLGRLDFHVGMYDGIDLGGLLRCTLFEVLFYLCKNAVAPKSNDADGNMHEVIEFLHENISAKLSLTDIAERFHYSKSYLCKEFLRVAQVPIMQYIRNKKTILADKLMREGVKPMDVYIQCGFVDYSTFYRAYRKFFGRSPIEASNLNKLNIHPEDENEEYIHDDFLDSL